MTLLSLSRKALQEMITMCYRYSCLWRYQYNPDTCAMVTFNESERIFKRSSRPWVVGSNAICEKEEYNHLGIICNENNIHSLTVKETDRKLRGALLKRGYM